jgi:hypothetical protein
MKARSQLTGILLAAAMLAPAAAQTPDAALPLSDAVHSEVVANAAQALRARYVFPDAGDAAARKIEAQLAAGAYEDLAAAAFADRVTADLQSVTHDKHMRVFAPGPTAPQPGAALAMPPPANEGGFVRADRLAGDIGYVEVLGFPSIAAFKPAADRAMAALQNTRALIIDDRRNTGGQPEAVAYLMSFFVDPSKPPVLLDEFTNRVPGQDEFTTNQVYSRKTPTSYLGKPVYVLTGAQTFSGGEGFAYGMQAFKFATVVGEVTGGGGHLGSVGAIGSGFGLFVPYGRPIHPVTKTDWDGVGVIPEIKTKQEDALRSAMAKLGQKVSAGDIDALSEAKLFTPRSTPLPGSEQMLRKMLATISAGEPDYDMLSPGFANLTRQQLPMLQGQLAPMGAVTGVTFVSPGAQGGDTYQVEFEKGVQRWTLILSADEKKVDGALFGPGQPKN